MDETLRASGDDEISINLLENEQEYLKRNPYSGEVARRIFEETGLEAKTIPEQLVASAIEDFAFCFIREAIAARQTVEEEDIADAFIASGEPEKITTQINRVAELAKDELPAIEAQAHEIISKIRQRLSQSPFTGIPIDEKALTLRVDSESDCGSVPGVLALRQVFRKAIDYCSIYSNADFQEVLKILTKNIGAHEVGHLLVDGGEPGAEYWGRAIFDDDDQWVVKKQKAIDIAVSKRFWDICDQYSALNQNKFNPISIMQKIIEKLDSSTAKPVIALAITRQDLLFRDLSVYYYPATEDEMIGLLTRGTNI